MFIPYDPDEWVSCFEHTVCDFHQKHPSKQFAGCTCSASFGQRKATPEEYRANRKKRLEERLIELREELTSVETALKGML